MLKLAAIIFLLSLACCTVIIKNFQTSEFFKVLLTLVLIINWAHICKLHSPYYYWLLLFFMTYFVVGIYTRLPVWGGIISLDLNREKCVRMLVQLTCEQNWFQMGQIVLISMQNWKSPFLYNSWTLTVIRNTSVFWNDKKERKSRWFFCCFHTKYYDDCKESLPLFGTNFVHCILLVQKNCKRW